MAWIISLSYVFTLQLLSEVCVSGDFLLLLTQISGDIRRMNYFREFLF